MYVGLRAGAGCRTCPMSADSATHVWSPLATLDAVIRQGLDQGAAHKLHLQKAMPSTTSSNHPNALLSVPAVRAKKADITAKILSQVQMKYAHADSRTCTNRDATDSARAYVDTGTLCCAVDLPV